MTPTGVPVEELARSTEDEVRERLAAGKLVEGLAHMSPEYLKGIRRILTVSADTELISAPAYLRAAHHAPALNNFGSAVSIIQDELAHAHIGYRLLGDLGVDMNELIYEREPKAFKYPYAFDVPLDSWYELVLANALYDQAGFVLLSDIYESSTFGPWKRALAKVDKEETFHLRHGRTWVKKLAAEADHKRRLQASLDWMFILTLEWFGLPDERKRHGIQLEYGFKGMTNDELRQAWMGAVVPFTDEVGLEVPAHWDSDAQRWAIDCPFPARFDEERKTWLLDEGAISWDEVMERWKARGPMKRWPHDRRGAPVERAARGRGPRDPDLGRRHGADRLARLPRLRARRGHRAHVHRDGVPGDGLHPGRHPRAPAARARGRRGPHRGRLGPRLDAQPHPRGVARDDAAAGDRGMTEPRDQVWEVFARQAYDEPLHHVGAVTESDEDLALVSARSIYDEQPWIQMIIVPRSAIREAITA